MPFRLLLPAALLLAACGFHPIYGARDDGPAVAAELNQTEIGNIPDRNGQVLRNNLIDRMYGKGRPQNPRYHLRVTLRAVEEGIGLLPNAITTLTELSIYADYVLTDETGGELTRGTVHGLASFNQLNEQYGTLAARENAYQRGINEVGEQVINRLSLYFSERVPGGPVAKPPS